MAFYSVGFSHWILQRTSALFLIVLIFSTIYFDTVSINNLILIVMIFHFKLGFETLFEDYTHDFYFKALGSCLLRLVQILTP